MMLQKYTQIPLFGFYIEAQIHWLKLSENAEKTQSFFMKYLVFILSVLQQKVDAKVSSSLSKVKKKDRILIT